VIKPSGGMANRDGAAAATVPPSPWMSQSCGAGQCG